MAYDELRGRQLRVATVADYCSVHPCTVHRWINQKQVLAVNLGPRCTRIDGDSLADFLATQVKPAKASALELAGQA